MTEEQAIKTFESWAKCRYEPTRQAAELAIAALRAQQPLMLDQSMLEGCSVCKGTSRVSGSAFAHYGNEKASYDGWTFSEFEFCPRCGRPLTEKAWAELERRIGGNDGTADNA